MLKGETEMNLFGKKFALVLALIAVLAMAGSALAADVPEPSADFYVYDGARPGDHLAPGDYYYNIELNAEVTADFPPTFHWFGRDDLTLAAIFTPWQGPALDRALEECGVPHRMAVYGHAPHGSGSGEGTDAAGWLADAAAFWEEVTA